MRPTRPWARRRAATASAMRTSSRSSSSRSSRSRAKVSSWPIDFTARAGSTARSSMPQARSWRWRPWAVPTAATSDGQRQRRPGRRRWRRRGARAGPGWPARPPTAPGPGSGWRKASSSPGAHHDDPRPGLDAPGRRPWAWPPPTPAWPASLVGATPTEHVRRSSSRDLVGGWRRRSSRPAPKQPERAGHVEERLVEGDAARPAGCTSGRSSWTLAR